MKIAGSISVHKRILNIIIAYFVIITKHYKEVNKLPCFPEYRGGDTPEEYYAHSSELK